MDINDPIFGEQFSRELDAALFQSKMRDIVQDPFFDPPSRQRRGSPALHLSHVKRYVTAGPYVVYHTVSSTMTQVQVMRRIEDATPNDVGEHEEPFLEFVDIKKVWLPWQKDGVPKQNCMHGNTSSVLIELNEGTVVFVGRHIFSFRLVTNDQIDEFFSFFDDRGAQPLIRSLGYVYFLNPVLVNKQDWKIKMTKRAWLEPYLFHLQDGGTPRTVITNDFWEQAHDFRNVLDLNKAKYEPVRQFLFPDQNVIPLYLKKVEKYE
ncbi:hypothetical protein [Asticcacaulis sp.]|uniref:hypothetical protein n=1 Tax=Asticcacaulis sp. TaxID=1872648 RepID=UPI002619C0D9|nr:hypothetical protein [Asticcacaulis sp.]